VPRAPVLANQKEKRMRFQWIFKPMFRKGLALNPQKIRFESPKKGKNFDLKRENLIFGV
jgi:hypothetical protein